MADVITLPGSPATIEFGFKQAREIIKEDFYNNDVLNAVHSIDQDIKGKTQLAFIGLFGKTGKADSSCGFSADNSLTTSEKFWNPQPVKANFEECWNNLTPSLFNWADGNGVARKDLSQNTVFTMAVGDLILNSLVEGFLRRVWFGDTTYVSGDFTNGASDLPFYNLYDGFFKQIFDSVTAGDIPRYTITENASGTAAGQLTLAADRAYETFKSLYENADTRLISRQDKFILVTRTLFDNYVAYLESKDNFKSFERIEGGFDTLNFRNIPVICFDQWDRNIQGDFLTGSPAVYDLPNRAIMTSKENLRVGLDSTVSLSQTDSWYSKDDDVWRAKYNTLEDSKIIHEYLVSAAY